MLTSVTVANALVVRAKRSGVKITPRKLLRLVYIVYGEYLRETGIPLFPERFEAWNAGPIVRNVYAGAKRYAVCGTVDYLRETDGAVCVVDEEFSPIFSRIADLVWKTYGLYSQRELVKLTKGPAWKKTVEVGSDLISDDDILKEKSFLYKNSPPVE